MTVLKQYTGQWLWLDVLMGKAYSTKSWVRAHLLGITNTVCFCGTLLAVLVLALYPLESGFLAQLLIGCLMGLGLLSTVNDVLWFKAKPKKAPPHVQALMRFVNRDLARLAVAMLMSASALLILILQQEATGVMGAVFALILLVGISLVTVDAVILMFWMRACMRSLTLATFGKNSMRATLAELRTLHIPDLDTWYFPSFMCDLKLLSKNLIRILVLKRRAVEREARTQERTDILIQSARAIAHDAKQAFELKDRYMMLVERELSSEAKARIAPLAKALGISFKHTHSLLEDLADLGKKKDIRFQEIAVCPLVQELVGEFDHL